MCGVALTYWKLADDVLAHLFAVERVTGDIHFGVGFENDRDVLQEAADECRVDIISVDGQFSDSLLIALRRRVHRSRDTACAPWRLWAHVQYLAAERSGRS